MAIQFKRKTSASGAPASGSLLAGEIALNTFDKKIYTSSDGTNVIEIAGGGAGTVLSVNTIGPDTNGNVTLSTDDISEGSTNFYYTETRFDTSFSTKTTSNLTEGVNLYWTVARGESMFDNKLAAATTDDLTEGSTNLYYTDARVDTYVTGTLIDDTTSSSTTLYSSQKIEALVTSGVKYKGHWDASTNTPTIADGTGNNGDYYIVSVAGTQDLGSGSITFNVGDAVIYDGVSAVWERSINSNEVQSVNGKKGVVVLTTDDIVEGSTSLYYTDNRVDTYVNTMGFAKIDDANISSTTTYSSQQIESLVTGATEVDDTATAANTTKTWSVNKLNASFMPIDVDYGLYT